MNFIFWGAMLLMLLLAISIVIFPLLRLRGSRSIAYKDSNLSLYEEKLAELDNDLAESRIDQGRYRVARQELDRELLDNVPEESRSTAGEHYAMRIKRHPALALVITVFVPAFAMMLYMQIGMQAAGKQPMQESQPMAQAEAKALPSVEEMTTKLETFLQQNEGGVQEWSMLGRAYKYLKRYQDSAKAFSHAIELQPDAQLMLEKAEALALMNGQKFDDESRALVARAKQLEPDNVNVLWFSGVAEFQYGNFRQSIDDLVKLSKTAEIDDDIKRSIHIYVEKARAELVARGEDVPEINVLLPATAVAETAPVAASASAPAATSGAVLHVEVSVSDEVRSKFSSSDAVFVYAKAAQGPKMPLAVKRITLGALPASVTLDDSMAMMSGMNLSAFPSVIVSARVSRSGSAIAQSGDYIAEYQVKDVGSFQGVIKLSIDKVVP